MKLLSACLALAASALPAVAAVANLLPLPNGRTVATCYSANALAVPNGCYTLPPVDPNGFVVAVFDTTPPQLGAAPLAVPSMSYNWGVHHNEVAFQSPVTGPQNEWRAANLGEVFGIALDDAASQNIYVAATSAYGNATWPLANGHGRIYRLDGTSGAITAFPALPGAGPAAGDPNPRGAALGNLCYYRTPANNRWLYVSNMGDGRIYRVNPGTGVWAGGPNDTFDHGTQALPNLSYPAVPDNATLTFTPPTRRPWGVGVHAGRLYYSIFASMDPPPPGTPPLATGPQPEVWSVALNAAGDFLPLTATREFKVPPLTSFFPNWPPTACVPNPPQYPINMSSLPISDIEFTLAGAMVIAERYHAGCISPNLNYPGFLTGAHSARVLEYTGASGSWTPSPQNKFIVGAQFSPGIFNSAGGVGPACDGSVWCSGDALAPFFNGVYGYGIQRIGPAGNAALIPPYQLSHLIDLDGNGNVLAKSLIGDVDTVTEPPRLRATMASATCPAVPGGPYTVTLTFTNLHPSLPISQILLGSVPAPQLPPGAQSIVPSPNPLTVSIPGGGSTNVNVTIAAPPIGGKVCFAYVQGPASPDKDPFECAPKLCIDLPQCPCMDVAFTNPLCPVYEGQSHSISMVITNQWPTPANWFSLAPCPQNELPPNAVTLQPEPQGLQPLIPPLGIGGSSPPITVTFPGLPVSNQPTTVCFIVQLLPQEENQGPFCAKKVCVTFPPCPPLLPCMSVVHANVQCPTAPPGNYSASLTITNQGPVPAAFASLTPCAPPPNVTGFPAVPSPAVVTLAPLTQGNSITLPIQLGGVPLTGGLGCFCVSLLDSQQRPICSLIHCVPLPACPCVSVVAGPITCPTYEGQPHTMNVTLVNTGFQPLFWYGLTPCPPQQLPPGAVPGVVPGPAGLQPLPPLNPGNSTVIPVTLTGVPKAGGKVCFSVAVFGEQEGHPICDEKLCVIVPPCPPCQPCMNATVPGSVQCPTVQGGPFTATVIVTNNQPVPAATALLIPCTPGLQPGEVPATPIPGSIALPPLLQNQSIPLNVALTGVTSGQLGCFCIQLLDAAGNKLCEAPVCLTMPQCPPLCATVTPFEVACRPDGSASAFINVQNLTAQPFAWFTAVPVPAGQLPPGAITGQPQPAGLAPFTPNIPPAGGGTVQLILPAPLPPAGGTFCFILRFHGPNEVVICEQKVCLTIPACQCAVITSHSVDCVPDPATGVVKPQLTFTVQNLTNSFGTPFSFAAATILPGGGFSPNVLVPTPNPIPPGGSGTFTTCFTGSKPPACIDIFLTNAERTRCCPLRLCPQWVSCAQPQDPHGCEMASEFVSELGAPAAGAAWIFNGSNAPQSFTWTLAPAAVPGCTATLPPNAFLPVSGTVGPVGPFSSAQVPFTINAGAIPPGQCAGFQFCFRAVMPGISPLHCCIGKVRRTRNTDLCVDWNPTGRPFLVGAGRARIVIKNPSTNPVAVSLLLGQSGGTEFSLTGEFPAGGSAGLPGAGPAAEVLPFDVTIPAGGSVPVSFTARIRPGNVPQVGPVWNHWHLVRLCRGTNPVPPDLVGTALVHVPGRVPGAVTPTPDHDFGYFRTGSDDEDYLQLDHDFDEILSLSSGSDLGGWTADWPIAWGLLQLADGSFAGPGGFALVEVPAPAPGSRRSFRRLRVSTAP